MREVAPPGGRCLHRRTDEHLFSWTKNLHLNNLSKFFAACGYHLYRENETRAVPTRERSERVICNLARSGEDSRGGEERERAPPPSEGGAMRHAADMLISIVRQCIMRRNNSEYVAA